MRKPTSSDFYHSVRGGGAAAADRGRPLTMSGCARAGRGACALVASHSTSVDELRVPVTGVGLVKLAVKRLPAPRRYVGTAADKCTLLEIVWEVGKQFFFIFPVETF